MADAWDFVRRPNACVSRPRREVKRTGDDVGEALADALRANGEVADRATDAAREQRRGPLDRLRLFRGDVEPTALRGVLRAQAGRGGGSHRCRRSRLRRDARERALNVRRREVVGKFVLLTFEID
ncbi:hypothetical protein IVB18_45390 [Bradyrhizobium sp. 186]|uniref:hypothetical protein n=1 Tax=Bradyrhizobium sp. 186 TaxID=2782654 RepID=UPI002000D096|nr:hypothetical protein [Bradyrhizobium sp. 186]UPK35137.1 hypothetical protein IVB18_45390 [Bradyrhizobium sp. 186]